MPFGNSNPFPFSDRYVESHVSPKGLKFDLFANGAHTRSREITKHEFNTSLTAATTNVWTLLATSTATTWAVLAEPGGWLRGVTGASVATGAVGLSGISKFWNGTKGAGFASLIRLSAVTDVRIEQGFVDVAPATGTTAVNAASNAFNSVTTGVVYLYDNGVIASTTTTGVYAIGSSTAFNATATTISRYDSAATLFVALEIFGRKATLWLGDIEKPVAEVATATTAADSWLPWFQVKTASGSKNVDVDAIWTWTVGRN